MTNTGDFNGISNDNGMGPIGISMQDMGATAARFGSTGSNLNVGFGLDAAGQDYSTLDA